VSEVFKPGDAQNSDGSRCGDWHWFLLEVLWPLVAAIGLVFFLAATAPAAERPAFKVPFKAAGPLGLQLPQPKQFVWIEKHRKSWVLNYYHSL
jgi:hypothetical protein